MTDEAPPSVLAELGFDANTAPACDEGLVMLKAFAEKYPGVYHLASRNNFIDPAHPAVLKNPLWLAFTQHYNACPKCNEVLSTAWQIIGCTCTSSSVAAITPPATSGY